MGRTLSKHHLHDLLQAQGHVFWTRGSDEAPIDVSPPVEDYLTVAFDPDGTLKPAYRDLYFACVKDVNDEPRIATDPAFAWPGSFAGAEGWGQSDFARGPARWLVRRLGRFPRVWLWPPGGFQGAAPILGQRLLGRNSDPGTAGIGLDLTDATDAVAFGEAVHLVGVDGYDFYVAGESGREVYLMHHHDKIIVSIPDADAFDELLAELDGLTQVFKDWSGYWCEGDEEFFGGLGQDSR